MLSVLSACGSVKDLADQVKESLIPPEPVNPPAPLKEIKATISPKILWKASMQNEEATQNFTPAVLDSFVFAISSDVAGLRGPAFPYRRTPGEDIKLPFSKERSQ